MNVTSFGQANVSCGLHKPLALSERQETATQLYLNCIETLYVARKLVEHDSLLAYIAG